MSNQQTYDGAISDVKAMLERKSAFLEKELAECEKYADLSSILEKKCYRLLGMLEALKQIRESLESLKKEA